MQETASALLNRLLARGKFRHLQVLLRLAELGSIQKTADAIGLTQSAVTQTLAYLEDMLGAPLFERHARGVRPTAAGRALVPVARRLMLGISDGAEAVVSVRERSAGVVRLMASATATHGLLAGALPEFCRRFPGIQILLREGEGEEQLLAIARAEVDLVICRQPAVLPEGWEFHPLREDRFAIVCRPAHPLAARRAVRWPDMARATWISLPAGLGARTKLDALFEQHFKTAPATFPVVTQSLSVIMQLLRAFDLLAVLPLNLVRPQLDSGELVELKTRERMPMDPIGVLRPAQQGGEAAARLLAYLRSLLL
ncbi:LysR family transcriptional regulator [Variovorax defluvii]|uniref:LysR family transcriptional regulator n=1 Tax=Variovorax defluvii TaxID=913761 RepID=A0ABP8IDE0_9BURK